MQIVPAPLKRLVKNLQQMPGIGNKSATRLALNILRRPAYEAQELANSILDLHSNIQVCSSCFIFSEQDPCDICANPKRDPSIVCVVEEPGDMMAIEKTSIFKGHYHILHGVISPIDGIGPNELKISELIARINSGTIKEILIATSSTVPGEATASVLLDKLNTKSIKITKLACGIPMGMDIKYADEHTLAKSIESRMSV